MIKQLYLNIRIDLSIKHFVRTYNKLVKRWMNRKQTTERIKSNVTYKRDGIPYSCRQEYNLINLIDNEAKRKKKGERRANLHRKLDRQANVHGTNTR